jgi:hypothetical protein
MKPRTTSTSSTSSTSSSSSASPARQKSAPSRSQPPSKVSKVSKSSLQSQAFNSRVAKIIAASALPARWSGGLGLALLALAVNAVLFTLLYASFTPQYNTRDDIGMMLLASGSIIALEPSPYLMFTNIVLGKILAGLYAATPNLPWYALYLIASLFAAHWALLTVALRHRASWLVVVVFAVYFWLVGAFMLLSLQFTMVSIMLTAAGVAMIFFYPHGATTVATTFATTVTTQATNSRSQLLRLPLLLPLLAGVAMLVVACWIRVESFVLGLALTLPAALILTLWRVAVQRRINRTTQNSAQSSTQATATLVAQCLAFAVALVLAGASYAYNASAYAAWNNVGGAGGVNVLEQNRLFAEIFDYKIVRRQSISQEFFDGGLAQAQWSVSDFELMMNWCYCDSTRYSTERLTAFIAYHRNFVAANEPLVSQQENAAYQKSLQQKFWQREREVFTSPNAVACAAFLLLAALLLFHSAHNSHSDHNTDSSSDSPNLDLPNLDLPNLDSPEAALSPAAFVSAFAATLVALVAVSLAITQQTLLRDVPDRIFHPILAVCALLPLVLGRARNADRSSFFAHTLANTLAVFPSMLRVALAVVALVAAVLGVAYLGYESTTNHTAITNEAKHHSTELRHLADSLRPNPKSLYVIWADGFPLDYIAPFDAPSGAGHWARNLHAYWFSWSQTMPSCKAVLARYGVTDLLLEMARKPNVFTLMSVNQVSAKDLKYHERYAATFGQRYPDYSLSPNIPIRALQPIPEKDADIDSYRSYIEVKFLLRRSDQ